MIRDFESLEVPIPESSDVCVIGSGAAGILLATTLAKAGLQVTLLEGGGPRQEQRSQEVYRSEIVGQPHHGIHQGRYRTYGGTTTQWGGQILELDESDFNPRQHVEGSGWPFPKSELTSFYERALVFEGLRRVERDDVAVRKALGLGAINVGSEFSTLYSRWCPERNFARLHEKTLLASRKLAVYTHASVTGFVLNDARTAVVAAKIRSFGGREALVAADRFVLCTGGIESVRLLLQTPAEGIAPWQQNGLLGRFYQDHIGVNGIRIANVQPHPAYRYFGYVTSRGFRYHNKIQMKPALQEQMQTLNAALTIGPMHKEDRAKDDALQMLRRVVRERELPPAKEALAASWHVPGIARDLVSARYRGEAPRWKNLSIALHCEQSPHSQSTITLSDERDELGLFRTRLRWMISDQEIHTLRTLVRVAAHAFDREHFAHIDVPNAFFEDDALVRSLCGDSNHHMGGARMSAAPADGIVDPTLRLHGIANAYLCSSSVFPCSGFSNPTHTVLALAMRLADHLAQHTSRQPSAFGTRAGALEAGARRMPTVTLPGTSTPVPQLGFGCSSLLGPGLDRETSRRLLDAAYDAGIRHFDVARLYGQGKTESLLKDFLRAHPDATVTTKFGVVPPHLGQRVLGIVQRRLPSLPRAIAQYKRNSKAIFNARQAGEALNLSLRSLGREQVSLYLLHEAEVEDLVHDDLLAFLEQQRRLGKIGDFGIGGESSRVQELYDQRRSYARVLQFECSILGPRLNIPGAYRIHYRTFQKPALALDHLLRHDAERMRRWSQAVDAELEEPLVLSRLLLRASLDQFPESLILFSSGREENIFENVAVASDDTLSAPAKRLQTIVEHEAPELLGTP